MAETKRKGDLAELRVASDLLRQGYRVALPFGEDWDFDLILYRQGRFERVQVKYVASDGRVIHVECRSRSLTHGRIVSTKHYTARSIDWLAVFDATTERCFYVPASHLGPGRSMISLRLKPALNGQRVAINTASAFETVGGVKSADD